MSNINDEIKSNINIAEKITNYSLEEVYTALQDTHSLSEIQVLYNNAGKKRKKSQAQQRRLSNRGNPQLQQATTLEITADLQDIDSTGASGAMLYSNDSMLERHIHYVNEGDIASRFSPAAYLTELYKNAKSLHKPTSLYYIDERRPDIAELLLSQDNQDSEVSTLDLSNKILTHAIKQKSGDKSVTEILKAHNIPFNLEFEKWQQVLKAQKTTAAQLWHKHINELTTALLDLGISYECYQQLTSTPQLKNIPILPTEIACYYALPQSVIEEVERLLASEKGEKTYRTLLHQVLLLHKATGLSPAALAPFALKDGHFNTDCLLQLHLTNIYQQRYGISAADATTLLIQDWKVGILSLPVATLLAECHQLTLAELSALHPIIADSNASGSYKFIESIYNTTQWLNRHQLNVSDLVAMTSTTFDTTQTIEIEYLVTTLQANVKDSGLDRIQLRLELSSLLAPLLGLSPTATTFLLYWLEERFDGVKVENIWQEIIKLDTHKPFKIPASVIAFCHQLGQLVLITKRLQLTDGALIQLARTDLGLTIVTNNKFTADGLMELSRYRDWMVTLNEQNSIADTVFVEQELGPQLLEMFSAELLEMFSGEAKGSFNSLRYSFDSFKNIETTQYWQQVAKTLHLPLESVLPLSNKMHDYQSAAKLIDSLTDAAFDTLPTPDKTTITDILAEKQSEALSCYYLTITPRLKTRDDIYSYLLIDNQVTPLIKTTAIGEAIASLQLYVNRCRNQGNNEGIVQKSSLKRDFFTDWDLYNKRYSSWAGINQLTYFPENYIDPALRIGQTSMMDTLLQSINQSQLSTDTLEDAFNTYLSEFEEVANLSVISGYHDHESIDQGLTYFIGESLTSPPTYYWRTVNHTQFDEGKFPATAWSEWKKIATAAMPYNQLIRPFRLNGRLYLLWLERREENRNRKPDDGAKWCYELKLSHLRYDGTWSAPFIFEVEIDDSYFQNKGCSLHCTASSSPTELHVCLYQKADSYGEKTAVKLWIIDEMMSLTERVDKEKLKSWVTGLNNEFDTLTERRISNFYSGGKKISVQGTINVKPKMISATHIGNPKSFAHSQYGFTDINIIESTNEKIKFQFKPNPIEINNELIDLGDISQLADSSLLNDVIKKHGENSLYLAYSRTINLDWFSDRTLTCNVSFVMVIIPYDEYYNYEDSYNYSNYGSENVVKVYLSAPVPIMKSSDDEQKFNKMLKEFPESLALNFANFHSNTDKQSLILPSIGSEPNELIFEAYDYEDDLLDEELFEIYIDNNLGIEWKIGDDNFNRYNRDDIKIIRPKKFTPISSLTITAGVGNTKTVSGPYPFTANNEKSAEKLVKKWDQPIELTLPVAISESTDIEIHYSYNSSQDKSVGSMIQTIPITVIPDVSQNYLALKTNKAQAQYLEWDKQKKHQVRLNTLFAKELVRRADTGIDNILSPETQLIFEPDLGENNNHAANQSVDFSGANGLYFWELFYYTPMLVMQRLLQEQSFDLATHWLSYVFNPTNPATPWNTRPLKEDTAWNKTPLDSTNPDAVAQADPMHYKLSTFMRLLDLLIARGDYAYRQQQRDTLAEAKMWYVQANNLLGDELTRTDNSSKWVHLPLKEAVEMADHIFLPQQNTKLQDYRQTLKLRLFHLRNNLSIDGQPLMLPQFTAPADAKALMNTAVESSQGGIALPSHIKLSLQRFPVVLESAKAMVGQLIQFGSSLSGVIEREDAEKMAVLMQTQGTELLAQSVLMQQKNLEELHHEITALSAALAGAEGRYKHYNDLYQENINAGENCAIALRATAGFITGTTQALYMTGAALDMVPNIYGMSVGGARYGAIANAIAIGSSIASTASTLAADGISTTEMYRRRRQEWEISRNNAEAEIKQITAQQETLKIRSTSAQLQVSYLETQQAQHQAQLALMTSKFTNQALYSWMRSRLSALYFQFYDLTVSRCLRAQCGYQWETLDITSFIKPGAWQGTYAGLLCGEALMLNLATLEAAYQSWQARELEIERTLSLAELYQNIPTSGFDLATAISAALSTTNKVNQTGENGNVISIKDDILSLSFNISALNLAQDYPKIMGLGDKRFFQQISVSLPALLGPYQSVQAVLSYTGTGAIFAKGCDAIALSRGMNDSGLFQLDFNDSNYLPFEGIDIEDSGGFVLRFPTNSDKQKALLQSLSDIILHIRYTIRS
ncbi:TPA: hypothetical protein SB604_002736 [Yersinia enterocolitica]|nr:hypothetical protein [Yersinia enterocolitica]